MTQERMSIADLARFLPDEARFVARRSDGVWFWYSHRPKPSLTQGRYETGGRCVALSVLPDIDLPWDQSLTEIRPRPRWRAEKGGEYFRCTGSSSILECTEANDYIDEARHDWGNYWPTEAEAKAYRDACHELAMKLHAEADR